MNAQPEVIVQIVAVRWTKAERGAPRAALRSSVPEALPLPATATSGALANGGPGIVVHRVWFAESNDFTAPVDTSLLCLDGLVATNEHLPAHGLRLALDEGHLRVDYAWSADACGQPKRRVVDATGTETNEKRGVLRLAPGTWGRVAHNGRSSHWSTGAWTYRRVTAGVAYGLPLEEQLFRKCEPAQVHEDLAELW